MELLLIRHGLPLRVENEDGQAADPALSELGREQAERLAEWLAPEPIDALYASPLRRALETAAPLARAKQLEVVVEPGVIEFDWRSQTYIPLEEIKAADPAAWRELVTGGLYAGIDIDAFHRTAVASLESIVARHAGCRVAVVCHGGVINAFAAHVLGLDAHLFFDPVYSGINRFLAASDGTRSVATLNESGHLR